MKRPYSLDFSIEDEKSRLEYITKLLKENEAYLLPRDYELMASYLLYGRDENGKNSFQRKECDDFYTRKHRVGTQRRNHYSLNAIMEDPLNPINEADFREPFQRSVYHLQKEIPISRANDGDIPGMRALWDAIDRMQRAYAIATGAAVPNEDEKPLTEAWKIYRLKYQLIELQRQQYTLRDAYRLAPLGATNPVCAPSHPYCLSSDSYYLLTEEELAAKLATTYLPREAIRVEPDPDTGLYRWVVRHQNIDYTNPKHIRCIMRYYSDIYMELWDKPDSDGRAVLFDFDRLVADSHFTPVREYIILRHIDQADEATIRDELREKFGVDYTSTTTIPNILYNEICPAIAKTARMRQLMVETSLENKRECRCCHRLLPIDLLFFPKEKKWDDGIGRICRDCQRRKWRAKHERTADARRKDGGWTR